MGLCRQNRRLLLVQGPTRAHHKECEVKPRGRRQGQEARFELLGRYSRVDTAGREKRRRWWYRDRGKSATKDLLTEISAICIYILAAITMSVPDRLTAVTWESIPQSIPSRGTYLIQRTPSRGRRRRLIWTTKVAGSNVEEQESS